MTTPRKIINSEYDRMQAPLTAQYQFERAERLQAELATLRSMTRDYPGGTPVADALQRVSQIQADNTNIAAWVQKDRELAALRKLADAVRSHGIGAELGQLREQRTQPTELQLSRAGARGPRTRYYTLTLAPEGTTVTLTQNHSRHAETFALADAAIVRLVAERHQDEPRAFVPPF